MYSLPIYSFQFIDVKVAFSVTHVVIQPPFKDFQELLGEGVISPLVCTDNKNIYISYLYS